MSRRKVVIDCDPGHDDAVALMLAFGSGSLDVLGVSTVAGNSTVDNTYRNARKVLRLIGAEVPVGKGASTPLMRDLVTAPNVHGSSGLDGPEMEELEPVSSPLSAFDLLSQTLASNPKVTLIPTGPLTNIAALLLARPELKPHIDEIILMGGAAMEGNWTPSAEFNIFVDPEAARVVFRSGVPITMIGLDVTHKALIFPDEVEALRKIGRIGRVAAELMDFFSIFYRSQGFKGNPLHDAVAVAAAIDKSVISTRRLHVDVEVCGELTLGRTVVDLTGVTGKPANAEVAFEIDRERFIKMIFDAVTVLEEKRMASL